MIGIVEAFVVLSFIAAAVAVIGFGVVALCPGLVRHISTVRTWASYAAMTHVVMVMLYTVCLLVSM